MTLHRLGRRTFLKDLGRGTIAVAVFGTAVACAGDDSGDAAIGTTTTGPSSTTGEGADTAPDDSAGGDFRWEQVSLGFVSAYVLARGNEAALVDTGVEGSEAELLAGLEALGLGWSDVGHVVLTHRHADHQGSAPAVASEAPSATIYAGTGDVEAITGVDVTAVDDGAEVFGLQVVATPGHTPGHISVFDPATRFLVAGDALNGVDASTIAGPNPEFSSDHELAEQQVAKLAALRPDTVVFGHGDPVLTGAAAALDALA